MRPDRTINVTKSKLMTRITQNLKDHTAAFEAASKTWAADMATASTALSADPLNDTLMSRLQGIYHNKPRSFADSYERAIEQLKFEVRDVLELSLPEFNQLACDEWDWARSFTANMYSNEALSFVKSSR